MRLLKKGRQEWLIIEDRSTIIEEVKNEVFAPLARKVGAKKHCVGGGDILCYYVKENPGEMLAL